MGTLLLVPSFIWIVFDDSVWPWDPAWYGEVSINLWATLRLHPEDWPSLMANAFGSKPPAVAWLGQFFVPFGYRAGNVELALLVSVVLCQIASVALVYAAVRRLTNRLAPALGAAVLLAGAPLFTALSHDYLADPITTTSVCWVLFVMASAREWRFSVVLAQLTASVALGVLSKLSAPLFMAAPVAAALLIAWQSRERRRDLRPALRDPLLIASVLAAAALSVGAVGWYRNNLTLALEHARTVDSTLWGQRFPYTTQLEFWLGAIVDATFLPYFGLAFAAVIAVGIALLVRRGAVRLATPSADVLCLLACVATTAAVALVVSRQVARETRYILPLVAIIAFASGIVVGRLRQPVLEAVAVALVSLQFAASTAQSFGAGLDSLAYARIRAPTDDRFRGTLDRIVSSTCTPAANNRISVVGVDYPWLNANTLALLADEEFALWDVACHYTPLGLAEQSPERAFQRLLSLRPPYFIGLDYGNPRNPLPRAKSDAIAAGDPFNSVNRAVHRRVLESRLFEIVPNSRRNGIVIFRARS